LIPHYSESRASQLVDIATNWKGTVHQIDIMMKNIFHIMDDIVKCEFVLSSSLHGIIFSDSYSIPNAHMNLTGRVTGGSYKFDDYFASVNRTRTTLELVDRTSVGMAEVEVVMAKSQQLSNINILPLWENAPMHAQAYNRSRQEHLDFARDYAKKFTDTLNNNPINLKAFLDQMGIEH
jgi:pyruvyltransferase